MPMAMLAGDGTAYRERLLSLGLTLLPSKWAKEALGEYIGKMHFRVMNKPSYVIVDSSEYN
jgi:hypothetical protein